MQSEKKEQILSSIPEADEELLDELTNAIIHRHSILFPDWEMMVLSLPKNAPEDRKRI